MGEFSKKAKGRIEQAVGGLTGNKGLQKEGEPTNVRVRSRGGRGRQARGEGRKACSEGGCEIEPELHHIGGTRRRVRPDDARHN